MRFPDRLEAALEGAVEDLTSGNARGCRVRDDRDGSRVEAHALDALRRLHDRGGGCGHS